MNRARLGALLGVFAGVLLCLSACSTDYSRSYNRALDTFASGEYAEAAEAFERLGDYAQAPAYAAYSRGWCSMSRANTPRRSHTLPSRSTFSMARSATSTATPTSWPRRAVLPRLPSV